MKKKRVGLIYGGLSSEHEVSIRSAKNVFEALDRASFEVTLFWIDKSGNWHLMADLEHLSGGDPVFAKGDLVFAPMEESGCVQRRIAEHTTPIELDVLFPMLHGQNGEDGRVQGFIQTLGLPYVGPDVLGSAACMDKEVTKRLLRDAGLPITPFVVLYKSGGNPPSFSAISDQFGLPFFVKPANSGSSVGITKVESEADYSSALSYAFDYDKKALIEKGIAGREIECAVLGNEEPKASVLGEIVSTAEFYTYDAKYVNADASRMEVPADLPLDVAEKMQRMAEKAALVLGCEGMARVDFFLTDDGEILINEINTIPGFTLRSMYPVMWEHSGLSNIELVARLVELAIARHERDARIKTSH